ncbi:hypothetical protein [uncultured Brevundimonas sp.]|uniref:hypothetical protein n=1 Tax=uncultured Brevundimonas sp. TaxID=213418 RepID=UPI00261DD67A|nr:hypothetical protein [uncultured Brevundimonas sp.]
MAATILNFPHAAPSVDDAVTDLLLALDHAPWVEPRVWVSRDLRGHTSVGVIAAGFRGLLTPPQARRAALCLRRDPPGPGAALDAQRLEQAADEADRGAAVWPAPRQHVTGRNIVLALGLLLIVVLILRAAS